MDQDAPSFITSKDSLHLIIIEKEFLTLLIYISIRYSINSCCFRHTERIK